MLWLTCLAWSMAAALAAAMALMAFAAARWKALTRELTDRLEAARQPPPRLRDDAARDLEGLPAPV